MTRAAFWLLGAGAALFAGIILSQGVSAVLATLALAGAGLLLVAAVHLVPLVLDAASIWVLFDSEARAPLRSAILARWAGESANSFLPAGPIGGPIVMARHLSQGGVPLREAAAVVTVSTTLQTLAQAVFALSGMAVLWAISGEVLQRPLRAPLLIAAVVLVGCLAGFYFMQQRGLFGRLVRFTTRFAGPRDWSHLSDHAAAIDIAVVSGYRRAGPATSSFLLSLLGWIVGTAEVYLILRLLGSPVDWSRAFLLESLGQAIRAAGFFIPGSLGVQEGGYLLLAPLAGLAPGTAVALSLAKRSREILLGLPGLLYIHLRERRWRRRQPDRIAPDRVCSS